MKELSDSELDDLLFAYCHGIATLEEVDCLQKLIVANNRVREAYVQYVSLHARLQSLKGGGFSDSPSEVRARFALKPSTGMTIELSLGSQIVGRSMNCEIPVVSPGVSRRHARIEVIGPQIIVHDLSSTNGTFVNGIAIDSVSIQVGDRIVFGDLAFTLVFQTELVCEEAAQARPAIGGEWLTHLTPDQMWVALALIEVGTEDQAARKLHLSKETFQKHVREIFRVLGVNSRDELRQLNQDR